MGKKRKIHPCVIWVLHPAILPSSQGPCGGGTLVHALGTAMTEVFWVAAGAAGPRIYPSSSMQGRYPLACAAQREAGCRQGCSLHTLSASVLDDLHFLVLTH